MSYPKPVIFRVILIGTLIVLPFTFTARRFQNLNEKIRVGAGFVSIGLGLFIVTEIGFVQGLLL